MNRAGEEAWGWGRRRTSRPEEESAAEVEDEEALSPSPSPSPGAEPPPETGMRSSRSRSRSRPPIGLRLSGDLLSPMGAPSPACRGGGHPCRLGSSRSMQGGREDAGSARPRGQRDFSFFFDFFNLESFESIVGSSRLGASLAPVVSSRSRGKGRGAHMYVRDGVIVK